MWTLVGIMLRCCGAKELGQSCRRIGRFCFDPFTKALQWEIFGKDGDPFCRCRNLCDGFWCITFGLVFCGYHLTCAIACFSMGLLSLFCCDFQFILSQTHLQLAWMALYPETMKLNNVDVDEGTLDSQYRGMRGSIQYDYRTNYNRLPKL